MIRSDTASLAVYSATRTSAEITAVLGLSATSAADIGDLTPTRHAGRPLKPEYHTTSAAADPGQLVLGKSLSW